MASIITGKGREAEQGSGEERRKWKLGRMRQEIHSNLEASPSLLL
jgi:hypothetical protein